MADQYALSQDGLSLITTSTLTTETSETIAAMESKKEQLVAQQEQLQTAIDAIDAKIATAISLGYVAP